MEAKWDMKAVNEQYKDDVIKELGNIEHCQNQIKKWEENDCILIYHLSYITTYMKLLQTEIAPLLNICSE